MKLTKLLVAAIAASFALSGAAMARTSISAISTTNNGNSQTTACINGVCTTASGGNASFVCRNNVCTLSQKPKRSSQTPPKRGVNPWFTFAS
jgi:hypothetical protein